MSFLLLILLPMMLGNALKLHNHHTPSLDWALVKQIKNTNTSRDCEFNCFLDNHCHYWIFSQRNLSCFLTSEYFSPPTTPPPPQPEGSTGLSTHGAIVQGDKRDFTNHVDRLLHGPLATSKSSYVNFPRKFYKGCSYTVSLWVWLYKTESSFDKKLGRIKEMALFSTRPSLPLFSDYEALLPAVNFNLGIQKEKLFFSAGKDEFQDYVGAWGDDVKYHEWTHITVVFTPKSFSPFVNGQRVRSEVFIETSTCPLPELVDWNTRSAEEKNDLFDDWAYLNDTNVGRYESLPHNTILDLSTAKGAGPLFGVYSDVDVFSGLELTDHHVKQLYDSSRSKVERSLPTLALLVNNYRTRGGKYRNSDEVLSNEYAMIAFYGNLPSGRVYGGAVCVEGLNSFPQVGNTQNVMDRDIHAIGSDVPQLISFDDEIGSEIEPPPVPGDIASSDTNQVMSTTTTPASPVRPEKDEMFIIKLSLGSKKFPYTFNTGVDPQLNAVKFCQQFWNDLVKAFEEADIRPPFMDVESCANVVNELSGPQVQQFYAISAPRSVRAKELLEEVQGSGVGDAVLESPPSLSSSVDIGGGVASGEVNSAMDGQADEIMLKVELDGLVATMDDDAEMVAILNEHLDAIKDAVKRNNADNVDADELEAELEMLVRGIEDLLENNGDPDLVARVEDQLKAIDGLMLQGSSAADGVAFEGSALQFQQLLINIETIYHSPDIDDESFYSELQSTIDELRLTFYSDGNSDQNDDFETHLAYLYDAFNVVDSSSLSVSDVHFAAFKAALDALHVDIADREAKKKTESTSSADTIIAPDMISSKDPSKDDIVDNKDEQTIAHDEPYRVTESEALLSSASAATTTATDGNLDTAVNEYNQQIKEIASFKTADAKHSTIEIKSANLMPKSNISAVRLAVKKQFASLELKMLLESYLRGPFHRQNLIQQVNSKSGNKSSIDNVTVSTTLSSAQLFSSSQLVAIATQILNLFSPSSVPQMFMQGEKSVHEVITLVKSYFSSYASSLFHFLSFHDHHDVTNISNPENSTKAVSDNMSSVSAAIISELVSRGLQSETVLKYIHSSVDDVAAAKTLETLNTSLTNALRAIYDTVIRSSSEEDVEAITKSLAFLDMDTLLEGLILQQDLAGSGLVAERDIFEEDRISESIRLYDSAMQWVDGRSVLSSRYGDHAGAFGADGATNTSKTAQEDADWEAVESSLIMSMWLSDELEMEHPLLASGGGMFQGCGMLGQSPRMALGYRHSVARSSNIPLARDNRVDRLLAFGDSKVLSGNAADIVATLETLLGEDIISSGDLGDKSFSLAASEVEGQAIQHGGFNAVTISVQGFSEETTDETAIYSVLVELAKIDKEIVGHMSNPNKARSESSAESQISLKPVTEDFLKESLSKVVVANAEGLRISFSSEKRRALSVDGRASEESDEATCQAASAYYFPVMQYVSSNYGIPESGVKHPEVFRLSDLGPMSGGLADVAMSLKAAVANWFGVEIPGGANNMPNFMGGIGGLGGMGGMGMDAGAGMAGAGGGPQVDGAGEAAMEGWEGSSTNAYFEQEAAEGNAEAQVWLGVRHYWGSSGYTSNATVARKYFEMAAQQNNGEALYCLGALYENGQGGLARNGTKALELFTRAANLPHPHPAALQVLGTHHHRGAAKDRNLTLAKHYYEVSAELGDSAGYFSLGNLYREGYGRKQVASLNTTNSNLVEQNIPLALHFLAIAASVGHTKALSTLAHAFSDSESWLGHYEREHQQKSFRAGILNVTELPTSDDEAKDEPGVDGADSKDAAELDAMDLASRWGFNVSEAVALTLPNGITVTFPLPYRPSCTVALPLLKYLSEFSYRPNDLMAQAIEQFLLQDYVGALKLFDEAAELGIELAQLNSAYLYKFLLSSPSLFPQACRHMIDSYDNRKHCRIHFQNKLEQRLVQLAHINNPEGFRELGDHIVLMTTASAKTNGLGVVVPATDGRLNTNQEYISLAGKMYAHSALKFKDITSLMSLADMVKTGAIEGIPKNNTLAKELYYTALGWERGVVGTTGRKKGGKSVLSDVSVYTYNDMGVTTGGVAPVVALLGIYLEEAVEFVRSFFKS